MNMKINNLILVLSLSIMTGCTAETIETTASNDFALEKSYGIEDVNAENTNPHAKNYYNLLKTVILATNSNQPQTRGSNTDNTEENSLVEKLESINILTETGDSISFFSMEEIEQTEFLEDWATLEANDMSEKLSLEPELETYIKEENEIVAQTIQEEAIQTRNGSIKIKNNDTFFKKNKRTYGEFAFNTRTGKYSCYKNRCINRGMVLRKKRVWHQCIFLVGDHGKPEWIVFG